jgi:hypothetical protein
MYVDKPVFKETLREWRAFGIRVDPNICRNILNLPRKDGKSINMQDRYICKERCDINIKITNDDLKVKNLRDKTHMQERDGGLQKFTIFPFQLLYSET